MHVSKFFYYSVPYSGRENFRGSIEVSNLNQSYTWVGLNFIEKPLICGWLSTKFMNVYPQKSAAIRLQYKTLLLFPIVATALVLNKTKILFGQLNCSVKLADVLTRCSSHPRFIHAEILSLAML